VTLPSYTDQTPSQTVGPMYGFALITDDLSNVDPDDPANLTIEGVVLDGRGEPVAYPDALVEVWREGQLVRVRTDSYGRWKVTLSPPGPGETSDGTKLAPYYNVTVFARGLMKQAMTRIYLPENAEENADDPILAMVGEERRQSLIAEPVDEHRRRFDIRLQGDGETVFFDF
jgi:protocatechuate 3,4-dioxygenase alpha subunit